MAPVLVKIESTSVQSIVSVLVLMSPVVVTIAFTSVQSIVSVLVLIAVTSAQAMVSVLALMEAMSGSVVRLLTMKVLSSLSKSPPTSDPQLINEGYFPSTPGIK